MNLVGYSSSTKAPLYSINVLSAQLFQDGFQYVSLPEDVVNNPWYKKFCKKRDVVALVNADQTVYQFKINDISYRFAKNTNSLYRQLDIGGIKGWYQFYEPPFIKTYYNSIWEESKGGFYCTRTPPLPMTMMEQSNSFWLSVPPYGHPRGLQQTIIMDEQLIKPLFSYDTSGIVVDLSSKKSGPNFHLINPWEENGFEKDFISRYKVLTQFEDINYIEFWKKEASPPQKAELSIRLNRYGLSFKQQIAADGTLGDLLWVEHLDEKPRYKVNLSPVDLAHGLETLLHLVPISDKPADNLWVEEKAQAPQAALADRVLVPKQQFIIKEDEKEGDSEYLQFSLDTQQRVMLAKTNVGSFDFYNPALQNYSNQESFAQYKISPTGALISEHKNDAVYLAYLYLARRQPDKAFHVLSSMQKNTDRLSIEQIKWLKQLIFALPALGGVKYPAEDYRLVTMSKNEAPEFLAVKTLAISIMVAEKLKQPPIIIPTSDIEKNDAHASDYSRQYNETITQELTLFWNDAVFYKIILPVYQQYLAKINKVPQHLLLEEAQEDQLLKQIIQHEHEMRVPTALKFKLQTLEMRAAVLEKDRLESLKSTPLSQAYQTRLAKIDEIINDRPAIVHPLHEYQEHSVALLPDKKIDEQAKFWKLLAQDTSDIGAKAVPVKNLTTLTRNADFIFSFKTFLNLAVNRESKNEKASFKHILHYTLESIARKRVKDPKGALTFSDNLSLILVYAEAYPGYFAPIEPLSAENIQRMIAVCATFPAIQQTISIYQPGIIRLKADLEQGSLPIKLTLEHPEPVASSDVNFKLARQFKLIEIPEEKKEQKEHLVAIHEAQTIAEKESIDQEPFKPLFYLEIQEDYEAGVAHNIKVAQRNKIATILCGNTEQIKEYNEELKTALKKQDKNLKKQMEHILEFANYIPLNKPFERIGNKRSPLSFEKILELFLTQEQTFYQKHTALSTSNIKQLNNEIFHYLLDATKKQNDERLQAALEKLSSPGKECKLSELDKKACMHKIGLILNTKRCYEPEKEPEMLLFEYLDNKLLYEEQYQYIKGFLASDSSGLGFDSRAVQLIMGGGKSKVLLPLLALKKATGTNLSVIEVPSALLQVNKADLSATTQKIFNKKCQEFIFDDTIVCNEHFLRTIYNVLQATILNREYLITTKESMQAFELKYLKFLETMNSEDSSDIIKARLFTDIANIFKNQGDVIIDEIDSTLDVKKQLIYTAGTGTPIPPHELKAILKLHQFFDKVALGLDKNKKPQTLKDFWLGSEAINPEKLKNALARLAEELINQIDSPLQPVIDYLLNHKLPHLSKVDVLKVKSDLYFYLLGEKKTIPECIQQIIPAKSSKSPQETLQRKQVLELLDCLALYKEEISSILPFTLKMNLDEHMGLPKSAAKTGIEREIAIPYLASNTPSEQSQFGNYLETLNYTLRIQLNSPLSRSALLAMIHHFKNKEEQELKQYRTREKPRNYQSPAQQFEHITHFSLRDIDLTDSASIEEFYEFAHTDPQIKEYCLLNFVLNYVEKNTRVLASDAQNHASQFRSVQGMTGTDWNYRCYPDFIKIDKTVSLGSDGQTRDHLLKNAQKVLLLEEAVNPEEKIKAMWAQFLCHHQPQCLHAWIDLGAYFKGITNRGVAQSFADNFFATPQFVHLKFVLFFGDDDKLYALPTDKTKQRPILLEQTDPEFIKNKLNCGPEHLFTYYDQRRITGTDIKQAFDAHAFVSLGLKTLDRDRKQAVMRMREINSLQRINFVIPKEVQDAYSELQGVGDGLKQWNVSSIEKWCIDNELEQLCEHHFRTALQKIKNFARDDLLIRLRAADPQQQKQLRIKFDSFIATIANQSAFEQFSGIVLKQKTEHVLRDYGDSILSRWGDILWEADLIPPNPTIEEDFAKMAHAIDSIIIRSITICKTEVAQVKLEHLALDSQIEVTKEKQNEKESEKEQEVEARVRRDAVPIVTKKFTPIDFNTMQFKPGALLGGVVIDTLQKMANTSLTSHVMREKTRELAFSHNLYATANAQQTCQEQPDLMDAFKKELPFFLVELDESKKPVHLNFLLLTNEEAGNIGKQLRGFTSATKKIWIESVHHVVKSGIKPAIIHTNPDYQRGIEQIAFFNADTDVLYKTMEDSESWLRDSSIEKLSYLRQVILPTHKDKESKLTALEKGFISTKPLQSREEKEEKKGGDKSDSPTKVDDGLLRGRYSAIEEQRKLKHSMQEEKRREKAIKEAHESTRFAAEFKQEKESQVYTMLNNHFIECCAAGDIYKIKGLLDGSIGLPGCEGIRVNINATIGDGDSALIQASRNDHTVVVLELLKNGVDVDHFNSQGDTALIAALKSPTRNKQSIMIDELLKVASPKTINIKNASGDTALIIAASVKEHERFVPLLLEKGADLAAINWRGTSALIAAIRSNNPVSTGALLNKMSLIPTFDINAKFKDGSTLLTQALSEKHYDAMNILMTHKPPPDVTNILDDIWHRDQFIDELNLPAITSLIFMVVQGSDFELHAELLNSVVRRYIKLSGDHLELFNQEKRTPLMLAVAGGQIDLVELLLNGITASIRNRNNNVNERRIKWVTLIAKVDTEAPYGITALKIARENGNAAIIQLLEKAAVAQKLAQEIKEKEVAALQEENCISAVAAEQKTPCSKPSLSSTFFYAGMRRSLGIKVQWTLLIAKLSERLTLADQDKVKNEIKEFLIKNKNYSLPMVHKHSDNNLYFILDLAYASAHSENMLFPSHYEKIIDEWMLLLANLDDTSSIVEKGSSAKEKIKEFLIHHPNVDLPMHYQSPKGIKIILIDLYRPVSSSPDKSDSRKPPEAV